MSTHENEVKNRKSKHTFATIFTRKNFCVTKTLIVTEILQVKNLFYN